MVFSSVIDNDCWYNKTDAENTSWLDKVISSNLIWTNPALRTK